MPRLLTSGSPDRRAGVNLAVLPRPCFWLGLTGTHRYNLTLLSLPRLQTSLTDEMKRIVMASVVLAYTGGIVSSVAIYWLQYRKGLKVFAYSGNFGGYSNQEAVCEKALSAGAAGAHIGDLRNRFLLYFAFPALRARAQTGSGYFLSRALTRPLLVEEMAKIARENGCTHLAHCGHPDSNDAIRFDRLVRAINPKLQILTPWSDRSFQSRQEVRAYAEKHQIEPLAEEVSAQYHSDRNLWGTYIEYGPEDDLWREPPENMYILTRNPQDAPAKPTYIEIEFRLGNPIAVDGEAMEAPQLMEKLNALGAAVGVGRADMIKDNLSGTKSRFVSEAPGATLLYNAHEALESITLSRDMLTFKQTLGGRYTQLINEGNWYTPLRRSLDAFVDQSQATVSGTVRLKLYRGSCSVVGVQSEHALLQPGVESCEGK